MNEKGLVAELVRTDWGVLCQCCGKIYSLHVCTVCPRCFTWPTWIQKEFFHELRTTEKGA